MRILPLLLLALALAAPAAAQNTTANETGNATTGDAGNATTDGNATSGGNATAGGNATNETPTTGGEPTTPAGPITIEIEGYQEGSATYFLVKGNPQRNPTITVQPGQEVTFVFTSVSGFHNLNVNGQVKTKVIGEGDTATITWTAPAEGGRIDYWCDPHKGAGMRGVVQVGGAAPAPGGDQGGAITGETIDLGQYDPACAGRQAPASVRDGVVGGPTLQDYIDGCKPKSDVVVEDKSGADLVIPISWALIGLGVVGVVWVHKYYKP